VTDRRQPRDPRIVRGVLVLGHIAHMLARSRRLSLAFEPGGGPWTDLNRDLQDAADVLAYREVLEAIAGSDCSRMIAKAQAYWPREAGPEVPERLLRTWRLAETLLGEFLQELAKRPVSFPATDGTPVQWEVQP